MGSRRIRLRVLAGVAVFFLLLAMVDVRLRPIMQNIAANNARGVTTRIINETVTGLLAEENMTYTDLVRIEKDDGSNITAIEADIVNMNRLKAELSARVQNAMASIDSHELAIPLGTLLGSSLLNGRGPRVQLKIIQSSALLSEFCSHFDDAGINQTRHEIMVEFTANIFVIVPGFKTSVEVKTNILVAETIIVGKVPDAYTQISGLAADDAALLENYRAK